MQTNRKGGRSPFALIKPKAVASPLEKLRARQNKLGSVIAERSIRQSRTGHKDTTTERPQAKNARFKTRKTAKGINTQGKHEKPSKRLKTALKGKEQRKV